MFKLARLAFFAPLLAGCASSAAAPTAPAQSAAVVEKAPLAVAVAGDEPSDAQAIASDTPRRNPSDPWIGAAGLSDMVLDDGAETFMGVWVDVPDDVNRGARPPVALSLIVDTSGSMAGPKMVNAKLAAKQLVERLSSGDIVSVGSFDDTATELVPPTLLSNPWARSQVSTVLDRLSPNGSTALFDGLRLGERQVSQSPATHAVRRVVVLSDGQANIGPTDARTLASLAEQGADRFDTQVSAIGIGLDYDEQTLNALAVGSSGRMYHLSEPAQLASILEQEIGLLQSTRAAAAFIDIVPAPGVQLIGVQGSRGTWQGTALRIPIGSMFAGQRRELLVKVRVNSHEAGRRPLASVRLHFRDAAEGNLERVQEAVAHFELTRDASAVVAASNARAQTILAMNEASDVGLRAAQQVNAGSFDDADKELAVVEERLQKQAANIKDAKEKQRVMAAAASVAQARQGASEVAAAPPAARPAKARAKALEINDRAMDAAGF